METLITDGGKYEISNRVTDLLQSFSSHNMNLTPFISMQTSLRISMVIQDDM